MNIDANTPERDEFDGDPLNPKHIEAVCGYLKNSPRDNLKVQALEIIEAQQKALSFKDLHMDNMQFQINGLIGLLYSEKPSFISRIVLWFKGNK